MFDGPVFWMLSVALALATWATVRIVRSELPAQRKVTCLIGAWIMPVIGPISMLVEVPRRGRPAPGSMSAAISIETPVPDLLEMPGRAPFDVRAHLMDGHGFPILDWQALDDWAIPESAPSDAHAAVGRGRLAWLASLRDVIPGTHLLETRDAWVLSSYEPRLARTVGDYVSTARNRITRLLEGVARFPPDEKTIFIALDSKQAYYHYVANYYPEDGEFSFSGGMYIDHGCPHFVTVKSDLWHLEPVIAHELTHSALAHLKLPLWLDEGIAVTTEDHVASKYTRPHREHLEKLAKHLNFWNAERMQEFWNGESFHRTDDGNTLSYDLAHNIVGLLGRDWRSFARFATAAQRVDGGAASARAALNLDLGDIAAAALNVAPQPGWSPDPHSWKHAPQKR
jgi:hypothetical protein